MFDFHTYFQISGPRFVLNPIRMFSGSFGGPTLYQNPTFVSPNEVCIFIILFPLNEVWVFSEPHVFASVYITVSM